MLTVTPNSDLLATYTASFDDDTLDRLLPKEPWFHNHAAYLASAAGIVEGFLQMDWPDAPIGQPAIDLHGAPDGVTVDVAVDIFGQDPDELAVGGVVYLDIPGVGDLRLAVAKATRDTDMFSAAHLYDPAAQIGYAVEQFCQQVDTALAPVDALLRFRIAKAA